MTALIVIWYLIGVCSFIFWWTTEHDLRVGDFLLALLVGTFGPVAFIMGYIIHGKPVTILRRRE